MSDASKKVREGEGELKRSKSEPVKSSNKGKANNNNFVNDAAVIKRLKAIYREQLLPV